MPFDFVLAQMQMMKPDPVTGELEHRSSIDYAMQTMKGRGPLRSFAGFPTFYVRNATGSFMLAGAGIFFAFGDFVVLVRAMDAVFFMSGGMSGMNIVSMRMASCGSIRLPSLRGVSRGVA